MRPGGPRYEQGKTRRILLLLPVLGAGRATLPLALRKLTSYPMESP